MHNAQMSIASAEVLIKAGDGMSKPFLDDWIERIEKSDYLNDLAKRLANTRC